MLPNGSHIHSKCNLTFNLMEPITRSCSTHKRVHRCN